MKLDAGTLHLLRLTLREGDQSPDGWAKVSKVVWPLVDALPKDLVETRKTDDGGVSRVTEKCRAVLEYT